MARPRQLQRSSGPAQRKSRAIRGQLRNRQRITSYPLVVLKTATAKLRGIAARKLQGGSATYIAR